MTRRKSLLSGFIFFLLVLMASPYSAQAQERVLSFDVTAAMQSNGAMIVTERIRVNIEHRLIRHGITHAYPIKERYDDWKLRHYGYKLISVTLDGEPSNYYKSTVGYASAIAIGQENARAPLGEHTYEVVYKTSGHVRPMKDRDEIYYNVMGNNWEFPVDRVSFTLLLPDGNENAFIDTVAYTGELGESGSDYIVEGKHTIYTTRTLQPGEGITVAMAWKKGVVTLPGESFANILGANRTTVLWGIFFIVLLYYVVLKLVIFRVPKGVVVPLFSPPEGMSPGYVACMKSMACKGRVLHADIVWAAVNGFFSLDARKKKHIRLHRLEPQNEANKPRRIRSGGEWARQWCEDLANSLFNSQPEGEVDLRSKKGKKQVQNAFDRLQRKYEWGQEDNLWKRSYIPAIPGAVLFLILYGVVIHYIYSPALDVYPEEYGIFIYMGIVLFLFGLFAMFLHAIRIAIFVMTGLQRVVLLIFAPLVCAGILYTLWSFAEDDATFMMLFAATTGVCTLFLIRPLGRYTRKGREALYKIQGLEMYIRAAEKNRLAKLNAPEDTIEKFEELLPYAVALGCAKAWQKRFDSVLAELEYTPEWIATEGDGVSYRTILSTVAGAGGVAAAANASAKAASAHSAYLSGGSGGSSSSSGSRGSSGFGGGSTGGGSGGTRVGGW
ncbi:MAG: DUF2207 domain-containing protein [Desulfomicrobium sp.]|nr:DUF2207 domain-containing protein [Desulfomicrobium sp.]